MAQILIRKIDKELMELLQASAKSSGRSVEDEAGVIINEALKREAEERLTRMENEPSRKS